MARIKKSLDYLNLPFEVHFSSIAITTYELMYDPEHPPKWMEDYPAIERLQGTSESTVFECLDNTHGELKAVLVAGKLEDYIPRWLSLVSEENVEMDSGEKFMLIDVREPGEFEIVRIPGSVLIPKQEFLNGSALEGLPQDIPIILHCKSGVRSAECLAVLKQAGFSDATHVAGGVVAWVKQIDPALPIY